MSGRPDGRQERWTEHKAQRRRQVVDAAIDELEQRKPGEDVKVQQIADRAGINRTVLYRHFTDRTDLDLAVQTEICRRAGVELFAAMNTDGTPRQITRRIVETYVRWAAMHPTLVSFADRDLGTGVHPKDQALEQLATGIDLLITAMIDELGVELPVSVRDTIDPFVFGLIAGGFAATQRWASRETVRPPLEDFITLLASNVWNQIAAAAADQGVEIPDLPVEDILHRRA